MIPIEDLMIGDWVQVSMYEPPQPGQDDSPFTDRDETRYVQIDNHHLLFTLAYSQYTKPIKLSKEFVEKILGYTMSERDDWWESEDKRVRITNDYDMINEIGKHWALHIDSGDMDTIMSCDVNYVHELQHAFKLCNYKQEIKLI